MYYPKKPMGGGNPYYACAYCGITDPQISISGHSRNCEYRIFMETGIKPSHDGFGNEWPREPGDNLEWQDIKDILQAEGWNVIQQSPLIIQDGLGKIETGQYAKNVLADILYDYEN